jgi:hypothetical protein
MTGRGTFVWASGERYDGCWREGKEDGNGENQHLDRLSWCSPARLFRAGTFTWPDGSYFDGVWENGVKHGAGIWVPAPPEPGGVAGAPREAMRRVFDRGQLMSESSVPTQQLPAANPAAGQAATKTRKKRDVRMGRTVYKGAPSYNLMLQLQLGIRWSVGRITPEPLRTLRSDDFVKGAPKAAIKAPFPRSGSSTTPPHESHDFKWKDYCPMVRGSGCLTCQVDSRPPQVFRKLREKFGIDAGDYMLSLCGAAVGLQAVAIAHRSRRLQVTWPCESCHRLASRAVCFSFRKTATSSSRRCARLRWHAQPRWSLRSRPG